MLMYTYTKAAVSLHNTKVTSSCAVCVCTIYLQKYTHTKVTMFVSQKTPVQNLQSLTVFPIFSAD